MIRNTGRAHLKQFDRMERTFTSAEIGLYRKMTQNRALPQGRIEFAIPESSNGMTGSVYGGTSIGSLWQHLQILMKVKGINMSKKRAAVLGGGIGRSAAALSAVCRHVDVYETVPMFVKKGKQILEKFGIENAKYHQKDFMRLPEETMAGMNLVYFYNPQANDQYFEPRIGQLLRRLGKGTVIISHDHSLPGLWGANFLLQYYPEDAISFSQARFSTFIRA